MAHCSNHVPLKSRSLFLAFVLSVQISACTTMTEAEKATQTEGILSAAGFRIKLADTPEKLAHAQQLTQHQIVPHQKDGEVYYVYSDATTCKCVYWGNEEAYQRYQQFALQRELADEQRQAAQMNANASMNWGMWGMGPWWMY